MRKFAVSKTKTLLLSLIKGFEKVCCVIYDCFSSVWPSYLDEYKHKYMRYILDVVVMLQVFQFYFAQTQIM